MHAICSPKLIYESLGNNASYQVSLFWSGLPAMYYGLQYRSTPNYSIDDYELVLFLVMTLNLNTHAFIGIIKCTFQLFGSSYYMSMHRLATPTILGDI